MASKKPWRTVIVPEDTGRFTREQIEAAIDKAKEQRERKAVASASKPPRQRGGKAKRGGRMASKKPWRTLVFGSETGRFTREQIDAAVLAVMAESERKAARTRKTSDGVAPREGGASKPAKAPAGQSRKTPKAA